jgi:nicotinate dehydrogenase subunit B
MSAPAPEALSRRTLLAGAGALVVSFALRSSLSLAEETTLPGSLATTPMLDAWIRIDGEGKVAVFTGKAELGQGIKTALIQVAAEELAVAPEAVMLATADTSLTPNEGYTSGSHSMQDSATAIMNAAAQVRAILIAAAAAKLGLPPAALKAEKGTVVATDGRTLDYGALVAGASLNMRAQPGAPLLDPRDHRLIGQPMPRVDIPAKVTGGEAFIQDLRLPDMVHGRVVWPPSYSATLRGADAAAAESMPGVLKVLRDGRYLAVIAEGEQQAIQAMRALAQGAQWEETPSLPDPVDVFAALEVQPAQQIAVRDDGDAETPGAWTVEALYRRAYQMHGSIGPSCAVGLFKDDALTLWTHSQGVYPLRNAIAELLALPRERVRCIHVQGSGCYGHNGADDVAADAAILATALPGRPVRVQWMRVQEHCWEPYGPAMLSWARAVLDDDGNIALWDYTVRSNTHSTRPGPAGYLLAGGWRANPIAPPPPKPIPLPEGGGDRNALPLYKVPRAHIVYDFVPAMPLRVSAMRGLGAYMNIFSIESFMDELAATAKADPVGYRLRHLEDARARDVVTMAAERFGWERYRRAADHGRGFAFARYKNLGAYLAIAAEVALDHESGRLRLLRAVAAVDSGQAVNPDGIRNQVEGGIIQSASWTLYESVAFDRLRITSRDWSSYPILRFSAVPESIDIHVIDRPGAPFLGTGEAAQGPTAAAIANALYDAAGVRVRELPLTAERVKAAIGI